MDGPPLGFAGPANGGKFGSTPTKSGGFVHGTTSYGAKLNVALRSCP